MHRIVAMASRAHRPCRAAAVLALFIGGWHLSEGASAEGPSLSELESRVDAAPKAAEAALDREEARLDDLAAQNGGRPLVDGRSVGPNPRLHAGGGYRIAPARLALATKG